MRAATWPAQAACMTTLTRILDKYPPGAYHIVTRSIRQARLCGSDPLTGRDCSHRKQWIEERIATLAESFPIAVRTHLVMSNEMHLVVQVEPDASRRWNAADVLQRWFNVSRRRAESDEARQRRIDASVDDAALVAKCRRRLGSVSCFMQLFSESIARAANAEEGCTERFWEGRFRCRALPDESAILVAIAEVEEARRVFVRSRFDASRQAGASKVDEPGVRWLQGERQEPA